MKDEVSEEVQRVMVEARIRWTHRRHVVAGLARVEDLSQGDLARGMGMSRQTLSTRLSGQSSITPWELDGFAVILGVERHVLEMEPPAALEWLARNRPQLIARTG
jgi:predicted DNA-binding protein (UPF0251 family)